MEISTKSTPVLAHIMTMKTVNLTYVLEYRTESKETISQHLASTSVVVVDDTNTSKLELSEQLPESATDVIIKTMVNGKTVAVKKLRN